jgi:DNA transposition AAA+ family ATPase
MKTFIENSLPTTDRPEAPSALSDQPSAIPAISGSDKLRTITETGADGKPRTITIYRCNEALRLKLRAMRDAEGSIWSNNKFATKLGSSAAVISQYLNDRGCIYNGDRKTLEASIEDFLRNEERRRASGVDTTWCDSAEQMRKAFAYIRKTNDVGAIIAESGEGKSRGIELIREENPLTILFHVRAWSCDKISLQSALWDVIPHIGYDPQTKRAAFIVTSLRGSDRPLIVDDAHKLTRPALHLLFDLYDETNIPIALVGTEDLLDKLEDDTQRFSRVGISWAVKPDAKKAHNRRALITHLVAKLAREVNEEREELIDLCEQVANNHGRYRSVEKQLKLAAELRATTTKPLTWCQAFRQCHTMLLRQYQLQ